MAGAKTSLMTAAGTEATVSLETGVESAGAKEAETDVAACSDHCWD